MNDINVADYIRNIPDFPTTGVQFKDITTLLKDGKAYHQCVDMIKDSVQNLKLDFIVGPEARGFLFGAPLAYALGIGFVVARKPGKLPSLTVQYEYKLEYGSDALEIHKDAIPKGARVAIVDDLLATGGTAYAAAKLVESVGGNVCAIRFAIELTELGGCKMLSEYDVSSLIQY